MQLQTTIDIEATKVYAFIRNTYGEPKVEIVLNIKPVIEVTEQFWIKNSATYINITKCKVTTTGDEGTLSSELISAEVLLLFENDKRCREYTVHGTPSNTNILYNVIFDKLIEKHYNDLRYKSMIKPYNEELSKTPIQQPDKI